MNQVNTVYYNHLATIFLIVILTGRFLIQDDTITYLSMSVLLFWVYVRFSDPNILIVKLNIKGCKIKKVSINFRLALSLHSAKTLLNNAL
jgi:hypothetical protein